MTFYVIVLVTSDRQALQSLIFFAGDKMYQDNLPGNYSRIYDNSAIKLLKSVIIVTLVTLFSTIFSYIIPIHLYVSTGDAQLPFPILFPFSNTESPTGLIINLLSQMIVCLYGIPVNVGIDVAQMIIRNTILTSSLITCHSIDEFSLAHERLTSISDHSIDFLFRNILIQVQDYDRYIMFGPESKTLKFIENCFFHGF